MRWYQLKKLTKILLFVLLIGTTNFTTYFLTTRLNQKNNLLQKENKRQELFDAKTYELMVANELLKTSDKSPEAKRELTLASYEVAKIKDIEN